MVTPPAALRAARPRKLRTFWPAIPDTINVSPRPCIGGGAPAMCSLSDEPAYLLTLALWLGTVSVNPARNDNQLCQPKRRCFDDSRSSPARSPDSAPANPRQPGRVDPGSDEPPSRGPGSGSARAAADRPRHAAQPQV